MLQDKKQMLHTLGYATFILSFDSKVLFFFLAVAAINFNF